MPESWEDKTWWKCENCGKEIPYKAEKGKDWDAFTVPVNVCALDHAKTVGRQLIILCSSCIEEKGKPREIYMGSLIFEKEG
jgi:hypothetical protein